MNTTEAIAEVMISVKRPDKRPVILSNINKAISMCTLRADFKRDIVEDTIAIDGNEYAQVLDLTSFTEIVRFRKFDYIRPTDRTKFLTESSALNLYSPSGTTQKDKYILAGDNLTIVLLSLSTSLEIGYFQYAPVLTEVSGSNTHWMLNVMPYVIIDYAKSLTFGDIGDDSAAKLFNDRYEEGFVAARKDQEG